MNKSIGQIYQDGQKAGMRSGADREKAKVGTLRAGTTGMLSEGKDQAIGVCPSRAYLRYSGVPISDEDESEGRMNTELMFEAGRSNEDIWAANLLAAGKKIKREEEIPTSWVTDNGVPVTGRPDIVILNEEGAPETVLELKLVCSLWKARSHFFNRTPSLSHMMQAAHYSWQLGVPAEIWYTSRANFAITGDWAKYMFPKMNDPLSEYCSYTLYRNSMSNGKINRSKITELEWKMGTDGKEMTFFQIDKMNGKTKKMEKKWIPEYESDIKGILPFMVGYELRWEKGNIQFRDISMEGEPNWHDTIVNLESIKRFYNSIGDMKEKNVVPPPPLNLEFNGKDGGFKLEDYCSLARNGLCCKQRQGTALDLWVDDIKKTEGK